MKCLMYSETCFCCWFMENLIREDNDSRVPGLTTVHFSTMWHCSPRLSPASLSVCHLSEPLKELTRLLWRPAEAAEAAEAGGDDIDPWAPRE